MTQRLYFDVTGQTLFFDCPQGRPSSVTSVSVFPAGTSDDGTTESATTGSASVETNPNTTFDANSGDGQSDPTILSLAATTGITIGRKYLATNALGEKEWVEVVDITSAASVSARFNLANAYVSSDTLEGTRVSISILDSWIQDSSNISDDLDPNPGFRVRWVYVVDSVTYIEDSYFDVVRYREDHDVLPVDVDARWPGWIDNLPTEYREDRGRRLIDEAYAEVEMDLHKIDLPAEMLRNRKILRRLVIKKAIQLMTEVKAEDEPILYQISRDNYNSDLDGVLRVVHRTAQATDSSGAASDSQTAKSIWEN